MLTREDLEAIQGVVERESNRQMNLIVENAVTPQLKALAEGQRMLLEKLAPKSRVEELEQEVEFLKSVIRLHSSEIAELKKAQ